jgi:hypothetical protein
MSTDPEKTATEVLRLTVGYDETVVALTTHGAVLMERWLCRYWSLRRDLLSEGRDVFAALWLRHVSDSGVDRETAEYVVNTEVYRVVKEESVKAGIDRGPDMKWLELVFWPTDLHVKKEYGNRVVYSLEPCREDVRVYVVRVFQPVWRICEYGEPEDCLKRKVLTESIKARGVAVDDVVDGVYVPLDASSLISFLRRVL